MHHTIQRLSKTPYEVVFKAKIHNFNLSQIDQDIRYTYIGTQASICSQKHLRRKSSIYIYIYIDKGETNNHRFRLDLKGERTTAIGIDQHTLTHTSINLLELTRYLKEFLYPRPPSFFPRYTFYFFFSFVLLWFFTILDNPPPPPTDTYSKLC